MFLIFTIIKEDQSQNAKNENPTNSPRDPPNSEMKEEVGYIRDSFCIFKSVVARRKDTQKFL